MALVGDIQLQDSAVKPPALDTTKRFSAEGLTATTAFAVTDAGAGNTVSTTGLITAKSSNDISGWIQTTKADGNVSLYLSNDARPDWALKVSGSASDAFVIANSTGANDTCQYPALSIGTAGAVGIGKYSASNALDISYQNSSSGGVVITEATNSVATKIISLATCSVMGTSTNHKLGFITNNTTVGMFDTSGNLGIGTEAPGATLDVRGAAIFNEAGAAVDFRIEGDTEANLFLVDGSADRIGIGTATPQVLVDIDEGDASCASVLLCVNGCICAVGYMGEKQGHTIQCSGSDLAQRDGLDFVLGNVGDVVNNAGATVVCINGANTCVPFLMCDGSTSDPISLAGGSIGNQLANDGTPCLGGTLNGCDENVCCICCLAIKGCYFGDGSQLTGVSSVPSSFSGDCTIIGCDAGGNVAGGGAKIVLIGGNAGYNATTPSNIVVMGSSAALCMTTATDTVLIGTGAGRCVLTCAGNLALGAWSLYNECAGSFNTALGTCAGLTQKGATTNTFVGAYAGTAVTTGSGNVFVGYKAGCAATTGNCCLIIGNGTCDIITGDFNTASLGINAPIYSTLTVGVNDTGYDVTFFGATSGCKVFWDESEDELQVIGTTVLCNTLTVGVNDTGHDVKFFGASSGAFMLYDESADTLDVRGATAAGPGVLKLTTGELTNVDGGILGRLEFQAPLDSAGTDAILVAASIWGEAAGTFAAACNKTDLVFATADSETATEKMRITSAGLVGAANGATKGFGLRNQADSAYTPRITNDANDWTIIRPGASGADVSINNYANSANLVIFTDEGTVGIGTATVGALLHLNTSGDPDIQFSIGGTDKWIFGVDNSDGDVLKINLGGTLGANTGEYAFYDGYGFAVVAPEANEARLYLVSDQGDDANDAWRINAEDGKLEFQNRTAGTSAMPANSDTWSERMMIDSSGNIGIGTATPGYKLDIAETAASPAFHLLNSNASDSFGLQICAGNDANDYAARIQDRTGTDLFRINGAGNVGIGTGTPGANLHISGGASTNCGNWVIGSGGFTTGDENVEFGYDMDNDNTWKLSNWNEATENKVMSSNIGTCDITFHGAVCVRNTSCFNTIFDVANANYVQYLTYTQCRNYGLYHLGTFCGTSAIQTYLAPTFCPSAGSNDTGVAMHGNTSMDNTGSVKSFYPYHTVAAGKTLATHYGIYIGNPAGAGTLTNNYGIMIENMAKGSNNYAIYASGGQSYFAGALTITGALSKGSGSFNIEHPLESKKETHRLVHSFTESPQADLLYSGWTQLTSGASTINIDTTHDMTEGTFVALNRCIRVFTSNESDWDMVRGSVTGNQLTIESNNASSVACISWMVIGERCDEHMYDTDWTDDNGRVIVEPVHVPHTPPVESPPPNPDGPPE